MLDSPRETSTAELGTEGPVRYLLTMKGGEDEWGSASLLPQIPSSSQSIRSTLVYDFPSRNGSTVSFELKRNEWLGCCERHNREKSPGHWRQGEG